MLREIDSLGRASGRWALEEKLAVLTREFDWECGRKPRRSSQIVITSSRDAQSRAGR